MDESKFQQDMKELNEGDFVLLKLDTEFMNEQLTAKRKMLEEAIKASEKRSQGGSKSGVAPMAPAKEALLALPTEAPAWCVGRVSECLMSVIYLVDVYEEGKSEPIRKGYEYREVRKLSKVTEEDYITLSEQTKK